MKKIIIAIVIILLLAIVIEFGIIAKENYQRNKMKRRERIAEENRKAQEKIAEENRKNRDIFDSVSTIWKAMSFYEGGIEDYSEGFIDIKPKTTKIYNEEIVTGYEVPSKVYLAKEKFKKARDVIKTINSENVDIQEVKENLKQATNYKIEGIDLYTQGLHISKAAYKGEYSRGMAKDKMGNSSYAEGLDMLASIIIQNKNLFNEPIYLAYELEFKSAWYSLDSDIEAQDNIEKAKIYLDRGEYREAIKEYMKAFYKEENKDNQFSLAYALYLSSAERYDIANNILNEILAKDSNYFKANYVIGFIYYNKAFEGTWSEEFKKIKEPDKKQIEKALVEFEKGLKIAGDDNSDITLQALRWAGEAYQKIDNISKAKEKYRQAINIFNKPYDFYHLAELNDKTDNIPEAISAYQKYLELIEEKEPEGLEKYLQEGYASKAEQYINKHHMKGMRELDKIKK